LSLGYIMIRTSLNMASELLDAPGRVIERSGSERWWTGVVTVGGGISLRSMLVEQS
jgi:hypothetical protein